MFERNAFYGQSPAYGDDPFANPWNPINANPGNWSIDPFYATPAYTAPYRPDYSGPSGYNPYDNHVQGAWAGLKGIASPTARIPAYTNPSSWSQPYWDAMTYGSQDNTVGFGQRYAVPAAAMAMSMWLSSAWKVNRNNPLSGDITAIAKGLFGASPAKMAAAASQTSAFNAMGDWVGQGIGRGIVRGGARLFGAESVPSIISQGVPRVLGGAMGIASSMIIPGLIAQGAVNAADSLIFDPYIANAKGARAMKRDFSRISFGSGGNLLTGRGLSYEQAATIGGDIASYSNNDMMFKIGDGAMIGDFMAQSGVLNGASNSSQVAGQIKVGMDVIKTIMRVLNEPSTKEAVKILANLRNSGLNLTEMKGFVDQLGFSTSIAGMSTTRFTNTVGMQGQYLAQQAGLLPYAGQMMAARSMASFAAGERSGVLNPAMLSLMGGVEGATQLDVTGQLRVMSNPYARAYMANKYMMGNANKNPVNVISNFAGGYIKDPYNFLGLEALNRPFYASKEMMDNPTAMLDVVKHTMADLNPELYFNMRGDKKGQWKVGSLFKGLQAAGMQEEEARAMLYKLQAMQDPDTQKRMLRGVQSQRIEQQMAVLNQEGLGEGVLTPFTYGARRGWKALKGAGSDSVADISARWGGVMDKLNAWWDKSMYNISDADTDSIGRYRSGINYSLEENNFAGGASHKASNMMRKVNDLIYSGVDGAKEFSNALATFAKNPKNASARNTVHSFLAKNGVFGEDRDALLEAISGGGISVKASDKGGDLSKLTKSMFEGFNSNVENFLDKHFPMPEFMKRRSDIIGSDLFGRKYKGDVGTLGSIRAYQEGTAIGVAELFIDKNKSGGYDIDSPEKKAAIAKMRALDPSLKGLSDQEILEKAQDIAATARGEGSYSAKKAMSELGIKNSYEFSKSNAALDIARKAGVKESDLSEVRRLKAAGKVNEAIYKLTDSYNVATTGVGNTADTNNRFAGISNESNAALMNIDKQAKEANKHLQDLFKAGKIDFTGMVGGTNANDMKEAVKMFGVFVGEFGKSTTDLKNGSKTPANNSTGTGGSWFDNILPTRVQK